MRFHTLLALFFAASPLRAETIDSVYTDLKLDRCKLVDASSEPEDGGRLVCDGLPGFPVHVAEGDLRFFVGFGPKPEAQCAMRQTFPSFNSLGPKVEWRRADGKPFATILRWYTSGGENAPRKSWLVVTRLGGRDTCHMAYVESASPQANALARYYADKFARDFECRGGNPVVSVRSADRHSVPVTGCDDGG